MKLVTCVIEPMPSGTTLVPVGPSEIPCVTRLTTNGMKPLPSGMRLVPAGMNEIVPTPDVTHRRLRNIFDPSNLASRRRFLLGEPLALTPPARNRHLEAGIRGWREGGQRNMSTVKGSKKRADLAKQLIAGTQKVLANAGPLTFAGGNFTPAQVEAQLQALATLRADAETAKAIARAKVAAERARLPALASFMRAFVDLVKAQFGTRPDVLAAFGLQPKKTRKPMTPEQKAAAKAKRAATRKARGIIGSRKRAEVRGDVTGVAITPITEPQPAEQTASNASNGASATK